MSTFVPMSPSLGILVINMCLVVTDSTILVFALYSLYNHEHRTNTVWPLGVNYRQP